MSNRPIAIKRLDSTQRDFLTELDSLLQTDVSTTQHVQAVVGDIIAQIKARGDRAVLEYTAQFDRLQTDSITDLVLDPLMLQNALDSITAEQKQTLAEAAERIRHYHQHQIQSSWQYTEADGTTLGQRIIPMDRVGIYVPGGKASYPSSVLMNAIPAKIAGVDKVTMVVPAPHNQLNPMVLAAAALAEVDQVIKIGGAQAVAALAYGTETIAKVDKIVGPGNVYVAEAKRAVFGQVDIDMIAGPSEILVVCDGETDPDWVAMDLFSQAEHDEQAQAILVAPDHSFLDRVEASINRLLPGLDRAEIITESLTRRGALIALDNWNRVADIINRIAPEHLELSVANPETIIDQVRHAGAIFVGRYTTESIGDYCAGPSHVLPTSGTARFSSPLGVYDFEKRTSVIQCSREGANKLGRIAAVLARGESLEAHARAAEYRFKG